MRKNAVDHKTELIQELAAARQYLMDEVRALAPDQVDQPCIGTWCVKDLLAHLVGWDHTNLQAVREILAGLRPSFFCEYDRNWQTYNAQLVALYRKDNLESQLAAVAESHHHLLEFLEGVPARDLVRGKSPKEQGRTVTVRNLLKAEASDERKHAIQLHSYRTSHSAPEP